jgi:hypothetical protein
MPAFYPNRPFPRAGGYDAEMMTSLVFMALCIPVILALLAAGGERR